jgi:hypothetical protein
VRLQSYWTKHNPGKKLDDWLEGLQNAEREDALKKASSRGEYWQEVNERPSEDSEG